MPRGVKKGPAPAAIDQAARLGDPRGAAQALRQLLRARVEAVLAAQALDKDAADELAKIASLLDKLEEILLTTFSRESSAAASV